MPRRRFPVTSFDQINVTPLIDTVFFLLIIFMITAPLLEYTIDVSPPKATMAQMKPDDNSKIININKNGEIIFEKKTISLEALISRLHEIKSSILSKNTKFFLRADKDLRYGNVIEVLRVLKNAEFDDVLLVTEDEK